MDAPDGKWLLNRFTDWGGGGAGAYDQPDASQLVKKENGHWVMHRPNQCRTCCCSMTNVTICPGSQNSNGVLLNNLPFFAQIIITGATLATETCISSACYPLSEPDDPSPLTGINVVQPNGWTDFPNGTFCVGGPSAGYGPDTGTAGFAFIEYYGRTDTPGIVVFDEGGCTGTVDYFENCGEFGGWTDIYLDLKIWLAADGTPDYTHTGGGWMVRMLNTMCDAEDCGIYASLFANNFSGFVNTSQPCLTDPGTFTNSLGIGDCIQEGGFAQYNGMATDAPYYKIGVVNDGTAAVTFCECNVYSDSTYTCPPGPIIDYSLKARSVATDRPITTKITTDEYGTPPPTRAFGADWPPMGRWDSDRTVLATQSVLAVRRPCGDCQRKKPT